MNNNWDLFWLIKKVWEPIYSLRFIIVIVYKFNKNYINEIINILFHHNTELRNTRGRAQIHTETIVQGSHERGSSCPPATQEEFSSGCLDVGPNFGGERNCGSNHECASGHTYSCRDCMFGLRRHYALSHETHRGSPKQDVLVNQRNRWKESSKIERIYQESKDGRWELVIYLVKRFWFSQQREWKSASVQPSQCARQRQSHIWWQDAPKWWKCTYR